MHEKRTGLALLSLVGLILATLGVMVVPASAAAPSALKAQLGTAVVRPEVVLRNSGSVTIEAPVTGSYSADEAPSTATLVAPGWGSYDGGLTCRKGNTDHPMNQSATATRTVVRYVNKGLIVDGVTTVAETATASDTVDLTGLADGTRTATLETVVQAFQTPRTVTQTAIYYRYVDGSNREQCRVEETFADGPFTDGATQFSNELALATSASDSYVLDLVAPVVEASFAGGGAAEAPTGGSINANIKISQGTPADGFSLTLAAYLLDGSGNRASEAQFSESTSGTIGNNGQEYFASIGLDVPCAAPLGAYDLVVTVSGLADLGGFDFADVVATVGTFEVVPSVNLVGTTQVFGWVDVDGDGVADYTNLDTSGFTAVQGGKVVNTSPGAFFATSLLKATGQCTGQTTMNFASASNDSSVDVTLKAPAGFAFVITGQKYTRVYAGKDVKGTLFDWERPALVGVTSTGDVTSILGNNYETPSPSTNPTVITVKLGNLTYWQDTNENGIYGDTVGGVSDTLKKGGALPADWKVFVKVRLRYIGTTVPAVGTSFGFDGIVHVDGYNGVLTGESKTNTYYLIRT